LKRNNALSSSLCAPPGSPKGSTQSNPKEYFMKPQRTTTSARLHSHTSLYISGCQRSPLPPTFLVNSPKFRAVVANSAAQLGAPFRNPIPEILMKFVATISPTS